MEGGGILPPSEKCPQGPPKWRIRKKCLYYVRIGVWVTFKSKSKKFYSTLAFWWLFPFFLRVNRVCMETRSFFTKCSEKRPHGPRLSPNFPNYLILSSWTYKKHPTAITGTITGTFRRGGQYCPTPQFYKDFREKAFTGAGGSHGEKNFWAKNVLIRS